MAAVLAVPAPSQDICAEGLHPSASKSSWPRDPKAFLSLPGHVGQRFVPTDEMVSDGVEKYTPAGSADVGACHGGSAGITEQGVCIGRVWSGAESSCSSSSPSRCAAEGSGTGSRSPQRTRFGNLVRHLRRSATPTTIASSSSSSPGPHGLPISGDGDGAVSIATRQCHRALVAPGSVGRVSVPRHSGGVEGAGELLQPLASLNDTFWALRPPVTTPAGQRLATSQPPLECARECTDGEDNWNAEVARERTCVAELSSGAAPGKCFDAHVSGLHCPDVCDCDPKPAILRVDLACHRSRPASVDAMEELATFGIEREFELGGGGWVKSAADLHPERSVFFPSPPEYEQKRLYHQGHYAKSLRRTTRGRWHQTKPDGLAVARAAAGTTQSGVQRMRSAPTNRPPTTAVVRTVAKGSPDRAAGISEGCDHHDARYCRRL